MSEADPSASAPRLLPVELTYARTTLSATARGLRSRYRRPRRSSGIPTLGKDVLATLDDTPPRPWAHLTTPARPPTQPAPSSPSPSTPTLHEDIYNLPNILTFSRIAAAPFIGYFVFHDQHAWALGLFAYAGISDLLDGYIARRWNKRTVVGTVIDPMADKMLMTVLTVSLAAKGALPRMLPSHVKNTPPWLPTRRLHTRGDPRVVANCAA